MMSPFVGVLDVDTLRVETLTIDPDESFCQPRQRGEGRASPKRLQVADVERCTTEIGRIDAGFVHLPSSPPIRCAGFNDHRKAG